MVITIKIFQKYLIVSLSTNNKLHNFYNNETKGGNIWHDLRTRHEVRGFGLGLNGFGSYSGRTRIGPFNKRVIWVNPYNPPNPYKPD